MVKKPPSYKHLRVFGYKAYCHIPKEFCDKLAPKSKKCIFLAYGEPYKMGSKLWDPIVFQEDGQVHNRQVAQDEQHGQNAPMVQEGREEQ